MLIALSLFSTVFISAAMAQQLILTQEFCTSEEFGGTGEFTCFALTDGTPNVWSNDFSQAVNRTTPQRFVFSFAGGQIAQLSNFRFITGDGWDDNYRTKEIRVQTTTDLNFNTATWTTVVPYTILPDTGNNAGTTVVNLAPSNTASARFVRLEVTDTYGLDNVGDDTYVTLGEFSVFGAFAPNISVNKLTTTPVRDQGQQASYTVVVTNSGAGTASGDVRITDTLPAGFTFGSATYTSVGSATGPSGASGSLTNAGSAIEPEFSGFTIPTNGAITITLLANISASITAGTYNNSVVVSSNTAAFTNATDNGSQTDEDVTVNCAPDNLFNVASVSSATQDIDPSNNTSSVCTIVIPEPKLVVTKVDAPDPVRRGQNLVYTLTITNTPESIPDATAVVLQDTLPAGLTWVSTQNSNGGGTCTVGNLAACNCSLPGNSGNVTCQMGTLTPGQTKTVVITTKVN